MAERPLAPAPATTTRRQRAEPRSRNRSSPWQLRRVVIIPAEVVPARLVGHNARAETFPVARTLWRPANFGDGRHARQRQIEHRANVAECLAPDRGFDADDALLGDA